MIEMVEHKRRFVVAIYTLRECVDRKHDASLRKDVYGERLMRSVVADFFNVADLSDVPSPIISAIGSAIDVNFKSVGIGSYTIAYSGYLMHEGGATRLAYAECMSTEKMVEVGFLLMSNLNKVK